MATLHDYLLTSLQNNVSEHVLRAGVDKEGKVHFAIFSRDHGGASLYFTTEEDKVEDYNPEELITAVQDPTRFVSREGLLAAVEKLPGSNKIGTEKIKEESPNLNKLPLTEQPAEPDPAAKAIEEIESDKPIPDSAKEPQKPEIPPSYPVPTPNPDVAYTPPVNQAEQTYINNPNVNPSQQPPYTPQQPPYTPPQQPPYTPQQPPR